MNNEMNVKICFIYGHDGESLNELLRIDNCNSGIIGYNGKLV